MRYVSAATPRLRIAFRLLTANPAMRAQHARVRDLVAYADLLRENRLLEDLRRNTADEIGTISGRVQRIQAAIRTFGQPQTVQDHAREHSLREQLAAAVAELRSAEEDAAAVRARLTRTRADVFAFGWTSM